MKLAKIEHIRCREYDATSYVWVADDMTDDELDKLCILARDAYLQAEHDAKTLKSEPIGYGPNYEQHAQLFPNKKIGEIKAEYEKKLAIWNEAEARRKQARKTFATLLIELGAGRIESFYDHELEIEVAVSWGHQHGVEIVYGEENPTSKELLGSLDLPRQEE